MKKVMIFGTFDGLHLGHLNFFEQAKSHGDFLIVVVARDFWSEKIKEKKPHFAERSRVAQVTAKKIVDRAVLGSPTFDYISIIKQENPDVICLGYDQKHDETDLKAELAKESLSHVKVVRLKPYKPDIFKTSKLRKDV
ncbi:MAG: hypothetical protein A2Y57_03070 [Candidatus Woykebacteria bacterium RBG_13_40_7b]|uniref:Cytidyltransferase-like domain-containing protein n=1 Tax=Candidatus Woykebacteria bacterium RBG_13_40_7b TaxID=1802594 RepID=A0A1G1W8A6_9BACT|nr:MAG: hypothetical protein A2Y57_03070 [Candidatus Woykebacteria bacterium RBG_13_40_7b]